MNCCPFPETHTGEMGWEEGTTQQRKRRSPLPSLCDQGSPEKQNRGATGRYRARGRQLPKSHKTKSN